MSEEWGPWIEHDGSGCPCVGQFVHARYERGLKNYYGSGVLDADRAGFKGIAAGGRSWFWDRPLVNIICYRIRKPKGLTILERIASQPQERVEA